MLIAFCQVTYAAGSEDDTSATAVKGSVELDMGSRVRVTMDGGDAVLEDAVQDTREYLYLIEQNFISVIDEFEKTFCNILISFAIAQFTVFLLKK